MKQKNNTNSKIDHSKTELRELSKTRTTADHIRNEAYMFFPDRDSWREQLIYTLYRWAELEQVDYKDKPINVDLVQFCMEYRISRSSLYGWAEQYPDIKKALDEVKLILACRRRIGALTKNFDKDVAFRDMHKYDPEWIDIDKYHAALKKDEEVQGGIRVIEIERIPSTGKVKPRRVDKETAPEEDQHG